MAGMYRRQIRNAGIRLPEQRSGGEHVYHLFPVRTGKRNKLRDFLKANGIGTNIHYPFPIHQMPGYRGRCWTPSAGLPETEKAAREELSLPIFPELSEPKIQAVIRSVNLWKT
ncbi:hypothetical protein EBX31_09300 [bacterium]|nr:hypothetical protein [bacterium]